MEIRRAEAGDVDAMYALERECFPDDPWPEQEWRGIVADPSGRNVSHVALDAAGVVASLMTYDWGEERGYVKITSLAVAPRARRAGNGRALLSHVLDEYRERGMHEFRGETREGNQAMRHLFEELGFRAGERIEGYYDAPAEAAVRYVRTEPASA